MSVINLINAFANINNIFQVIFPVIKSEKAFVRICR